MKRPLLISDCDEVLLHMVAHFAEWLEGAHDVHFDIECGDFASALTRDGEPIASEDVWPLLTEFFRGEMHRQTLVPGALEALGRIGEVADIVILTNLGDEAHPWRVAQLATHGIVHEVVCNRGGKGVPARAIIDRLEAGGLLYISGQISFAEDGSLIKGRLGEDVDLDAGIAAARRCGVMLLAQMKAALGSLDRVGKVVKLGVFVSSAGDFTDPPQVANGASELMQDVFGEAGGHARSAVGVPVLPLGVAVEVDAIVAIRT